MELFIFSRKDSWFLAAGYEEKAEDLTVFMVAFTLKSFYFQLFHALPCPLQSSSVFHDPQVQFLPWIEFGVSGLSGCGEWGEDLGSSCSFQQTSSPDFSPKSNALFLQ